jgi:hypothetical protein
MRLEGSGFHDEDGSQNTFSPKGRRGIGDFMKALEATILEN